MKRNNVERDENIEEQNGTFEGEPSFDTSDSELEDHDFSDSGNPRGEANDYSGYSDYCDSFDSGMNGYGGNE
ncbi:MAG: hypothetical protein ACI845_002603 [Gammaproteobacteria bacterium]|jgi:hypothetical protein